jgi:hypothetical protein
MAKRVDKTQIVAAIRAELERELAVIAKAAEDAQRAATHEESKPENEYDTRGLERSYLARGQAQRAAEIQRSI